MEIDDGAKVLVCSDPSTARRYALRIPREVTTCDQAQNWLSFGLSGRTIHRS